MFHWRHGWHFGRGESGEVVIQQVRKDGRILFDAVIPENEWASIVASVSAYGETGQTWQTARMFHNGEFEIKG